MFVLEGRETISHAIERAKAVHPKVRVISFGTYEVAGSKGFRYTVRCERRGSLKVVDCNCMAGTFGTPCLHAASAIPGHLHMAARRAA